MPLHAIHTNLVRERFSAVAMACFMVASVTTAEGFEDEIAALYAEWDQDDRPGLAVAILDNGEMVYAQGFGMANVEKGVAIDADSMFNIASISKQFTAGAIARLHLDGKLQLQDPVSKYVPGLPDWGNIVTVEQLVHHQSGVPDIFGYMAQNDVEFEHIWGNADVVPHIEKMSLDFQPGEKFRYSNTNYVLLAEIVRHVSGLTLRQYTDKYFFEPLGMNDTRIDDDLSKDQENLVVSYGRPRRNEFAPVDRRDVLVGDGNVVTTLNDFAKWDAELRNPKLLGESWRDLMLSRIKLDDGELNNYAFGLIVKTEYGDTSVSHSGSWLRFRSQWIQLRNQGVSVIVFGNHGSRLDTSKVLEIYLYARNSAKQ